MNTLGNGIYDAMRFNRPLRARIRARYLTAPSGMSVTAGYAYQWMVKGTDINVHEFMVQGGWEASDASRLKLK